MSETDPLGAKTTYVQIQKLDAGKKIPSSQVTAKRRQYLTAIIVNISALAAGSVSGWTSPSGPVLISPDTPLGEQLAISDLGWLASINFIAAILGTLTYGVLSDRLGRRMAGLALAVPFVLSWVLVAATSSIWILYLARVLGGIAMGGTMVICPVFVGETADEELRGPLGTFPAVGFNAGMLFTFAVGAVASYRVLPLVCMTLPILFFLGLLWLPETPVYHVKRGRAGRAVDSLQWYRAGGGPDVDAEFHRMQVATKKESSNANVTLADLFGHVGTRRALVQSLFLFINQQFCGVIAVLSYTEQIFQQAGSAIDPAHASIIVGLMQAVFTYLSSFLMTRFGRKTLLATSNAVMAASIAVLGGCFYAQSIEYSLASVGWLPVTSMCLYVIFFALGVGPVPLVLLGEIYTTKVRSRCTSIGIAVQSLSAFGSVKLMTVLQEWIGMHGALWFFAGCCLLGVAFSLLCVLETRDKTLEQILREFNGEPPVEEGKAHYQVAAQEDGDNLTTKVDA